MTITRPLFRISMLCLWATGILSGCTTVTYPNGTRVTTPYVAPAYPSCYYPGYYGYPYGTYGVYGGGYFPVYGYGYGGCWNRPWYGNYGGWGGYRCNAWNGGWRGGYCGWNGYLPCYR